MLRQNARSTLDDCSAVEFQYPEVEPLEKTATGADLADVAPVPWASLWGSMLRARCPFRYRPLRACGYPNGVASAEWLGCQAGDPARHKSEG